MKLSSDDLYALLSSRDFKMLPAQMAMEEPYEGWEQVIKYTLSYARKCSVWEACHRVADLMELYPHIGEFQLIFTIGYDDDPYLDTLLKINGNKAGYTQQKVMEENPESVKIDGGTQLWQTVQWAHGIGAMGDGRKELVNEINGFDAAFKQPITSPQQARERAREHAPEVEVWVRQRVLGELVSSDSGSRQIPEHTPRM